MINTYLEMELQHHFLPRKKVRLRRLSALADFIAAKTYLGLQA